MRIGFYHESAGSRHAGGIAVYIQHMISELSAAHEVYLYTKEGELTNLLRKSDVTVVQTPQFDERLLEAFARPTPLGMQPIDKIAMTLWASRNGVLEHIDDRLDVLITFHYLDDLLLSRLVETPTVFGYHRFDTVGLATKLRERFSGTETVVANSEYTAQGITETFGYEPDAVIYPGVDVDRFHPDAEPSFSSDEPAILFIGRLYAEKGIDDLLEAFAGLETPATLHIVGDGETERVRRRCEALEIADAVTIHGEVPHVELPGYYTAADVFCLPSHTESFGMVNLEAMACATPVVTSDLPAIREYLDDGENGLLVRAGDPDAIRETLSTLLSSPDLRARLRDRARDRAHQYSWETQAERLADVCASALAEPRTRREPIPRPSGES